MQDSPFAHAREGLAHTDWYLVRGSAAFYRGKCRARREETAMTVHQCPKCELRFVHRTELDDHCWHDHPEFRHDYPAVVVVPEESAEPAEEHPPVPHHER